MGRSYQPEGGLEERILRGNSIPLFGIEFKTPFLQLPADKMLPLIFAVLFLGLPVSDS
jgi:hypothetical protein